MVPDSSTEHKKKLILSRNILTELDSDEEVKLFLDIHSSFV